MSNDESTVAIVAIGLVWTIIGPVIFLPGGEGERDLFDYSPVGFVVTWFLCGPMFWLVGLMAVLQLLPDVIYELTKGKKEDDND